MKKPPPQRAQQKRVIDAAKAEQAAPYYYLLVDRESLECLSLGAVNARVEVQARRLLES